MYNRDRPAVMQPALRAINIRTNYRLGLVLYASSSDAQTLPPSDKCDCMRSREVWVGAATTMGMLGVPSTSGPLLSRIDGLNGV